MCVSPVDRERYPLDEPGGLTHVASSYEEAVQVCDEIMMRLQRE